MNLFVFSLIDKMDPPPPSIHPSTHMENPSTSETGPAPKRPRATSNVDPGDDWAFMEALESQVREAVANTEVIDGGSAKDPITETLST